MGGRDDFEVEAAAAEQRDDADAAGAGQRAQGVAYGGGADADGGGELALGDEDERNRAVGRLVIGCLVGPKVAGGKPLGRGRGHGRFEI